MGNSAGGITSIFVIGIASVAVGIAAVAAAYQASAPYVCIVLRALGTLATA